MNFCSSHVSLGKVCRLNRQCFHETEMQCTSVISAITHCFAGKFYHTYWRLEERCYLLNISTSIKIVCVVSGWFVGFTSERFNMLNVSILFYTLISNTDPLSSPCNVSMHKKDRFFIKAAYYTIILQAYFVRVDHLLLVKFCDLKQQQLP